MGSKVKTQDAPQPPTGTARTAMILVLFASDLLASLSQSIMNVALDNVATTFHITLSQANWMVLGYTIVAATTVTMAATLLKRFGLCKVLTAAYVFALVGSLLGFAAWSYPVMIVARLLQAVCTGLCFPIINEALLVISPKGQAGRLLAVNSGIIGAGLAFAPPLSGLIITYVGLRELFLVPAAIAVILLVAGHFAIHDIYSHAKVKIDIPSVILALAGLGGFMYGLNEISHSLAAPLSIMVAGIAVLAVFVVRQLRIDTPLLNLKPFKYKVFTVGEVLVMLSYMASIYLSLLVPLFLEGAASLTPFVAGCMCIVPILCYAICCFPSGHLLEKHGVWPLVPLGFAIVLAGYVGMFFTSSSLVIVGVLACAGIAYAGIGIMFPAIKSVDLESLPHDISSHGSSIHSTVVQLASSVSSALFVGFMSGDTARMMAQGMSKADAYASGFSHTLLIIIGLLVVAIVIAVIYTRVVKRQLGASDGKKDAGDAKGSLGGEA